MFKLISELNTPEIYKLLVGGVLPRPIAWISTQNAQGIANIAPYSFFTVASVNPPILAISHIAPHALGQKDTLANLQAHPECVVHVVSADLVHEMNASCAPYPNEISEFEAANIPTTPSQSVDVLSAAMAKVRYECTLQQVISLSDKPAGGQLILLSVKGIYVDDSVMQNGAIQALNAIGKMGGDAYCTTTETFELARPTL